MNSLVQSLPQSVVQVRDVRGYRGAANHSPCPSQHSTLVHSSVLFLLRAHKVNFNCYTCVCYTALTPVYIKLIFLHKSDKVCILVVGSNNPNVSIFVFVFVFVFVIKYTTYKWYSGRVVGSNYPSVSINPPVAATVCLPSTSPHSPCHSCNALLYFHLFLPVFLFNFQLYLYFIVSIFHFISVFVCSSC